MPQEFVGGQSNPMQFQVTGQGSVATLCVTSTSWDEEIELIDVSNSCSGAIVARLATLLDGQAQINAFVDLLAPPWLSVPGIFAGTSGILLYYVSPLKFFQIPGTIQKVHYEQAVRAAVAYNFTFMMNSLAGTYVRPS